MKSWITRRDVIGCGRLSCEEMKAVLCFFWIGFNIWKGWLPEGESWKAYIKKKRKREGCGWELKARWRAECKIKERETRRETGDVMQKMEVENTSRIMSYRFSLSFFFRLSAASILRDVDNLQFVRNFELNFCQILYVFFCLHLSKLITNRFLIYQQEELLILTTKRLTVVISVLHKSRNFIEIAATH